jgi:hypothetical protein
MQPKGSLPCSQEPPTGPYPEPIESSPLIHTLCLKDVLISSSHLCLCLINGIFPEGSLTKILYKFFISSVHVTCPAHLNLLYLNILIFAEQYKL